MPKGKNPEAAWEVEAVDVDVVRPLRMDVLRPGQEEDAVAYKTDLCETAEHFVVRDEGKVIGICSLHCENRVAGLPPHRTPGIRIRGMAVDADKRRQGVGAALLARVTERATELGAQEIWANAREKAISLYARQGFKTLSSEFEIPDIGIHVVMAKAIKQPKSAQEAEPPAEPADA